MLPRRTVLAAALAVCAAGLAPAEPPPVADAPPVLPPGLAKSFGPEAPEEAWVALHPTRDDGAWFLIDYEWTLVTGLSAAARAEVRAARKLPARTPPLPPPDVGVALHVVRFGPPR